MKKAILTATAIFIALLLGGCGLTGKPGQSMQPSAATTPAPSAMTSPTPSPSESMEPEETPYTGDLPAYIQAGLPKREKMTDIERWYYYDEDLPGVDTNDIADHTFGSETKADLDGDGNAETVKLIPGKQYLENSYYSITVEIEGRSVKLAGTGTFELCGEVVDIDNTDGKKELLFRADMDIGCCYYLVSYDNGTPRILCDGWQNIEPNGTGYNLEYWGSDGEMKNGYVYYLYLDKLRPDHSGFDKVKLKYYRSFYTMDFGELNAYAPTQWDETLAKEPGGKRNIAIKQGTRILPGLYYSKGWIQLLDENGNSLGWLDVKRVDFFKYTDGEFEPEGD